MYLWGGRGNGDPEEYLSGRGGGFKWGFNKLNAAVAEGYAPPSVNWLTNHF